MVLKTGTKEHLDLMIELERRNFGNDRAEIREAYGLILELGGEVLLEYRDGIATGMLAIVDVSELLENRERVLSLPENSPFRERFKRGYLDKYTGYKFINAFVSEEASKDLLREFLNVKRAVGFVYDEKEKLETYEKLGCRKDGTVQNIHSPEKVDYILVREI